MAVAVRARDRLLEDTLKHVLRNFRKARIALHFGLDSRDMQNVCGGKDLAIDFAAADDADFVHTLGDAHIYHNHFEQVALQRTRRPKPLPFMKINPEVTDLFGFRYEDFELIGYEADASIKAPIAV